MNSIEECLHINGSGWWLLEDGASTEADRASVTEEVDADRVVATECINNLAGSVESDSFFIGTESPGMREEAISEFADDWAVLVPRFDDFLVSYKVTTNEGSAEFD